MKSTPTAASCRAIDKSEVGLAADTPAGDSITLFISGKGAGTLTSKGRGGAETWKFWIVDVEGEIVTMGLYSSLDEMADHLAVVEDILATFTWQKLL